MSYKESVTKWWFWIVFDSKRKWRKNADLLQNLGGYYQNVQQGRIFMKIFHFFVL